MSLLLHTFPNDPPTENIVSGSGAYLMTQDGKRYLDMTSGATSCCILGYAHPEVTAAIKAQVDQISYIDYKAWLDPNREALAELLLSRAEHGLDRVFFTGQSGSESCEAAMKLSYQAHQDSGRTEKSWFIAREQSYHGATLHSMVLSDRPNLQFFHKLFPGNCVKIPQHHPNYRMRPGETLADYAERSARELEDKILEIGPEKVCAFIAETIMGGLVGNVPPAPGYWQHIRRVCDRYNVHLIMDEVYCGTGTSGKIYCCDWDGVTPDFIMLGKTMGAGYIPLSAVVTSQRIEQAIAAGQGRVGYSSTHQGHGLGVATALAVQRVIHRDETLDHVQKLGRHMSGAIEAELGNHPFFVEVRGRGLRFAVEHKTPDNHRFGTQMQKSLKEQHGILLDGKWHRVAFAPPFITTMAQADEVVDRFVTTFKALAGSLF